MAVLRQRDRCEGDLVIEVAFTGIGLDVGDRASDVERQRVLTAIAHESGAAPVLMRQVHGARVAVIEAGHEEAGALAPPEADAMVTRERDVALLSRAADCVPVLLGDPDTGTVAAVHAGRAGVVAGVVTAAADRMAALGAKARVAWIGPHVCGRCYEVPQQMRDEAVVVVPETASTTSWGTPALDLGAGVRAQLSAAGVGDVRSLETCTMEDETWPSHRRQAGSAPRFAALVWSHA